jgi:hypothetical protein
MTCSVAFTESFMQKSTSCGVTSSLALEIDDKRPYKEQ